MSGARVVDVWGSASGPLTRLSPQGRIAAGGLLLAAVVVADPATWPGLALWAVACFGWLIATRPPTSLVGKLLLFGLALFAPWFLLVPWIEPQASVPCSVPWVEGAWVPAWRVFFRGMGGLLVGVWGAATLRLPDLACGLAALPIPRALSMLLVQIVHRTHALFAETRGMVQAIRVRGAANGLRAAWATAAALPRVWMPRIIDRAERVSDAMEVRGFDSTSIGADATSWRRVDVIGLGLPLATLATAVTLRVVLS